MCIFWLDNCCSGLRSSHVHAHDAGHVALMLSLCSYQNRLLHPGASTADILSQYISTMKSLHVVDPSGAAAERVCQPVQAYLRCGVLLGATLAGSGGTPCPVMQHCNCLSPQPTPTPLVIQNQRRHCAMHCGQPH